MKTQIRPIAVLISLVLVVPNSYAAVKAGSSCSKAGIKSVSTGKTYTCVKSGKKLVWNKGVAITVAKPAPTASAAPVKPTTPVKQAAPITPWSSTATADEISEAAQANFRSWAAKNMQPTTKHKLILQDGVPSSRAANFSAADKLGSQIFGEYLTEGSVTVIGSDEKWVVQRLKENGGNYNGCAYSAGNPGLDYCLDGGGTQGYVVKSDVAFQPQNLGSDGSSLLAHEYFHIVQYQMADRIKKQTIKDGNAASKNLFPAWLIEGSANFVGFSVAAMAMGSTYGESRQAMFRYAPPEPSMNRNALEDYEIRNGPGNNSPTYPYIAGQLASEFIVASVGFEKFLQIFTSFKQTNDFDKSFKLAIGISKEDFYEKFEKARINLGLQEVSWKLVCLTNTPIKDLASAPSTCSLRTTEDSGSQGQDPNSQNNPIRGIAPPPIDRNSNVDGQGCSPGDDAFTNSFGRFVCTSLANGNNLWKKSG
jgi:hypothetical protein